VPATKIKRGRIIGEGFPTAQEGGAQQNYVPPFGGISDAANTSYYGGVPIKHGGVVQPCPHQILRCLT
jgi:hypothetical protein